MYQNSPVVVSCSRATDIPAFYGKWFIESVKRGYCVTTNPFNGTKTRVSFDHTRVFVFWTKNPEPFIPYLQMLDQLGFGYYFLFTLNNYPELVES